MLLTLLQVDLDVSGQMDPVSSLLSQPVVNVWPLYGQEGGGEHVVDVEHLATVRLYANSQTAIGGE